jgi:HK97 family phage major capsid protein
VPGPNETLHNPESIAYVGTNGGTVANQADGMFAGYLDPVQAGPLYEQTRRTSLVQSLARRIPMAGTGVEFKDWSASIEAEWVGEGQRKPVKKGTFEDTNVVVKPHKIAVIFAESAEVVRANPRNYLQVMRNKVAEAFAKKFDDAVLRGTQTPFGAYVNQTTKEVTLNPAAAGFPTAANGGMYTQLNNVLKLLTSDRDAQGKRYKLRSWLLDEALEATLNGAIGTDGRPLFVDGALPLEVNNVTRAGRILGRPAILMEDLATGTGDDEILGYAGDWSKVLWGPVGGISYDVSDQATLVINDEIVSLWQHNLVAVRCEAEYGVLVQDPEAFVRLTNDDGVA